MAATTDVVVVGGGMAGAAVAWELSRHGAGVVLLERERDPGTHSTGRSAAVLTETTGPPVVRRLAALSRAFFANPPAGFASAPLAAARPVLWVATQGQRDRLEAKAAEWSGSAGAPAIAMLDGSDARRLVPLLREGYVATALLEPDGLDIDVDATLRGYLRAARAHGATVATRAPVIGIARRRRGWRVETPDGHVDAAVVVNAAGAWADVIAGLAGIAPLGLVPRRRTAFVFPPPAGVDVTGWPLVMDADEAFYVKPDAGLLLASPCDEAPSEPCDARADELDVAVGVDRVHAAFALEVRGVRRAWAGLRTFAADGAPVAGRDPESDEFVWLAGQGGYGIKTAPALAAVAAAAVIGVPPPPQLIAWVDALSPARFGRPGTCR